MNGGFNQSFGSSFSVVVPVNDRTVFEANLGRSPDLRRLGIGLTVREGFKSVGAACNEVIDRADTDYVVLAHQDIYLPDGWFARLRAIIADLDRRGAPWGVLGVFGIAMDDRPTGHVYSSGLGTVLGQVFREPVEAQSLDECVVILNRSTALRLDPSMPGFHLYGTDLCLTARSIGRIPYIVSDFCLHNSNSVRYLALDYLRAYLHMMRKWRGRRPIVTCCSVISPGGGLSLIANMIGRRLRYWLGGQAWRRRCDDPAGLCRAMMNARDGDARG